MVRDMSNKQLDIANDQINAQKAELAKAANMRKEEREMAEQKIKDREEMLARERRERERLAAQLKVRSCVLYLKPHVQIPKPSQ